MPIINKGKRQRTDKSFVGLGSCLIYSQLSPGMGSHAIWRPFRLPDDINFY